MKGRTLASLIAALAAGTVVLVATAQVNNRAPFWPALNGKPPVLKEWFTDIPWHQKLGTYVGNEIDEALILPYEALGPNEIAYCENAKPKLTPEQCMVEIGVNNVLGMLRTDTLYDPTDPKIIAANECPPRGRPCIEVMLELSSFWTRSAGSVVELQARPLGTEPQRDPYNAYYGGYVITDGSTYGPQMPWYMAHYCDSKFPGSDVQDPVCYGDYLSPMNSGFNALPGTLSTGWPRSVPWSVYPNNNVAQNHCKGGNGETKCTLVLAGFPFTDLLSNPDFLQYKKYNDFLLIWFNRAVSSFATDAGPLEGQHHFPWNPNPVPISWETFLYPQGAQNPFLGQYLSTPPGIPAPSPCDMTVDGKGVPPNPLCSNTGNRMASLYLYPRQCTLDDLTKGDVTRLRDCSLNYELHHNGYLEQWPETGSWWADVNAAGMLANQYGRTSFLFAGVPGMQMPVSFYKDSTSVSGLSVYEQVHNASIFSLFLPIANEADRKNAFPGRNYTDVEFYHTLLMTNHMESDPSNFADGIRGKTLWHNEYRTQKMYGVSGNNPVFPAKWFAAAFQLKDAKAPFHNNTCDGCHLRNGSGVPISPGLTLDTKLQTYMQGGTYDPTATKDYTFTGQIRPMKLVFFDLHRPTARVDASRYSEPLAFAANVVAHPPRTVQSDDLYYSSKIMNFYGDSFHVTKSPNTYSWSYETANPNRLVVGVDRFNSELQKKYEPWQIKLGAFMTDPSCQLVLPSPTRKPWPSNCTEVNGDAITAAIAGGEVGFMHLNGKRLGNLSAIEAIPSSAIVAIQATQATALGPTIAGEIVWNAGSRDGVGGPNSKVRECKSTPKDTYCYIGRFGWLGDRVSLEDQVANAAFVEMNMTSREGYETLYGNTKVLFPIRYAYPNCGPANKACVESGGNVDLTEKDIDRMADYARWLGNPTRSDFQVSLPEVIAGENVFRQVLKCDTCHVIRKIDIIPDQTMLTKHFRDRLTTRVSGSASPFLSYLGTDLLMHDMGYLSQVANASQSIRDKDGVVLPKYQNYVQKIRTPPLKGLRFNRFVTDSYKNTKDAKSQNPQDPACDFLLHDGRACDAIEAAFLHDGPAIKKLGVIEGLNRLAPQQLLELRAFLYSL
jgi:CxxC motif-containing protein (DUF1111 family)